MSIGLGGFTRTDQAAQVRHVARQIARELPADQLERRPGGAHRDGYVVDRRSGELYYTVWHTVMAAGVVQSPNPGVSAFYWDGQEPVFLVRVSAGPTTVDELEAQAVERERQRAEKVEAQRAEYARQPRSPVTLHQIRGGKPLPTVAAAAAIVEHHGGEFEARDGALVIYLGEKLHRSSVVRQALEVLYTAAPLVIAEIKKTSPKPLSERLPNSQVLAGGGVA